MYYLPQEIELWYVIPAIRKELSEILIEKYGLKQVQVANILGVSKAAVSQYLHSKKANNVKFPKEVKKEIEKTAELIHNDNSKFINEITRLLFFIKKNSHLCPVCKKYNKEVTNKCKMVVAEVCR